MKYGKYNTDIKPGQWRLINWFHWGDAALRNLIDVAAAPQRRFILRWGRSSLFSRFWIHCSVEEMSEKHWFLLCTPLTLAFSPRSAVVVCVFGTSLNRDETELWCVYRILSISGFLIRWLERHLQADLWECIQHRIRKSFLFIFLTQTHWRKCIHELRSGLWLRAQSAGKLILDQIDRTAARFSFCKIVRHVNGTRRRLR